MLKGTLLTILLFITGCSTLKVGSKLKEKVLSCSEKAEEKSLQYLEQQYRCTSQ